MRARSFPVLPIRENVSARTAFFKQAPERPGRSVAPLLVRDEEVEQLDQPPLLAPGEAGRDFEPGGVAPLERDADAVHLHLEGAARRLRGPRLQGRGGRWRRGRGKGGRGLALRRSRRGR